MDRQGDIIPLLHGAEALFLLFYSIELAVRFFSFARKSSCLKDFWFKYDMILVSVMWLETVLTILDLMARIEKLNALIRPCLSAYRMARFVKVLRAMPSVVTITFGILAAIRSVMSTIYILSFELFCVAVIFRARFGGPAFGSDSMLPEFYSSSRFLKETEEEFYGRVGDPENHMYEFRNVNNSVFACLLSGVFTDSITDIMFELSRKSQAMMMLFLLHVGLTNLTLLNILVGVICQVIQEATDAQRERAHLRAVKELLLKHLEAIDENNNKLISPIEYKQLISVPEVSDVLEKECAIEPTQLLLIGETLFFDRKNPGGYREITFGAVVKAVLSLRGGQPSKAGDMMVVQRDIKYLNKKMNRFQDAMNKREDEMIQRQKGIDAKMDRMTAVMEEIMNGMKLRVSFGESPATSGSKELRIESPSRNNIRGDSNDSLFLVPTRQLRAELNSVRTELNSVLYREAVAPQPVSAASL
jgi:hypothetical protein